MQSLILQLDPPTNAAIGPSRAMRRAATSKNPTTCTLPSDIIIIFIYLVIAQSLNTWAVRPHSQSTHRPTREAGQLLPISVTLPAPATLHVTPFVDVADGIDGDGGIVQVRIVQLN